MRENTRTRDHIIFVLHENGKSAKHSEAVLLAENVIGRVEGVKDAGSEELLLDGGRGHLVGVDLVDGLHVLGLDLVGLDELAHADLCPTDLGPQD